MGLDEILKGKLKVIDHGANWYKVSDGENVWLQSYDSIVAFMGSCGLYINKKYYKHSTTTNKSIYRFFSKTRKEVEILINNNVIKLIDFDNYEN